MSGRKSLRAAIAQEAARLMLEEGVKEYLHAKHQAADALLGPRRGAHPLPSNRQIRAALVARAEWLEGPERSARLRHMRVVALQLMHTLERFQPRLIGSTATGAIHRHSDVDLQLFTDRVDWLELALDAAGLDPERQDKEVNGADGLQDFLHFHLEAQGVPVELSVYPQDALWEVSICSVTGRPMDRVPAGRVAALLRRG